MRNLLAYIVLTFGAILFAVGVELILVPNGLIDSGVAGLSIMSHEMWNFPIWLVMLVFNLPILFFTAKDVGRKFVIRTLYANVVSSLSLMFLAKYPAITSSEVLVLLYGGLTVGIGIGLVVKAGGAIDGTEMLAIWVNKHYHVRISTFLLAVNAVIFTLAAFVFTLEKALFSIAIFYLVMKAIDFILDGFNQAKSIMIISSKADVIGEALIANLNMSITYLYGEGGYKKEQKKLIYCISDRFMYPKVKDIVIDIDPDAILEASFATEATGITRSEMFHKK